MYARYIKRILDFVLSLCAFIVLSPLLLILIILGVVFIRGNPFFTQERPGKNGKIFKLIKFRTMDNRTDDNGEFLPDESRLNMYGRLLRASSFDELLELVNIVKGDMSIVGPRPLLPRDVAYMNDAQLRRQDVRPGLTGLAQCSGRNLLDWDTKLELDVEYVDSLTFTLDCKIILKTVLKVFKHEGVSFEEGLDMDLKDWNKLKKHKSVDVSGH